MVRVAVDLDSVLAQTVPAMLRVYNATYQTSYTKTDITDYSAGNVLPELQRLGKSKGKSMFFRLLDKAWEDWQSIEPEPGAIEAVRRMKDAGLQIDIVTGRSTTPRDILELWLRQHGIPYDNLIVAEAKPGEERRTSELKTDLPYDIFVVDNPFMAKAIAGQPDKFLLLFDQPWNVGIVESENVVRVHGWPDAVSKVGLGRSRSFERRPSGSTKVRRYPRHI